MNNKKYTLLITSEVQFCMSWFPNVPVLLFCGSIYVNYDKFMSQELRSMINILIVTRGMESGKKHGNSDCNHLQ